MIEVFPKLYTTDQVGQILHEAIKIGAVVSHTFVDPELRQFVRGFAANHQLPTVDLIGPLMDDLSEKLGIEPVGKPGLYRQLFKSYFERIDAMDFSLAQDDGKNPAGWNLAEIIILGVSRVGKTPISIYLSVLGWKVANIPLIGGIPPRKEIFSIDTRRMVGLTIAPSELIEHRRHRQKKLGVGGKDTDYIDPQKVYEEIEEAERFLRKIGITTIDCTGKPIESSADEIVQLVKRKLERPLHDSFYS